MARKIRIDMVGARYGRLVGLAFSHSEAGHAHWLFACDCGATSVADGVAVRSGRTTSCGCHHREVSAARLTTHGRRAGKRHDATYRAWQEINTLCTNPAVSRYRDFGGRGIAVCSAWARDFATFAADMGERPRGTILARLDQGADFDAANCRWAVARIRVARPAGDGVAPVPGSPRSRSTGAGAAVAPA